MLQNIISLILFFIILVIIEYFIFKYLNNNKYNLYHTNDEKERFKFNSDHEKEIIKYFKNIMNKRLEMLKKMDYSEWIEYNNINTVIEFNNIKYYIYIYEKSNIDKEYILRASYKKNLVNYSYLIERNIIINNYNILGLFPPPENLPEIMYNMSLNDDGFNEISHNWEHAFLTKPVKKNSIFTQFHKDNFNGIIGIGYSKENLYFTFGDIYYNLISKFTIYFIHFFILLTVIILYLIRPEYKEFLICCIILFFSWLLLIYQGILKTNLTSSIEEINNEQKISDSVLSISFLIAVNIFFIETLNIQIFKTKKSDNIKKQIIFLFCVSVLTLLFCLFQTNNYKSNEELRDIRITKQIYFNYCIYYSIIIIFFYILHNYY